MMLQLSLVPLGKYNINMMQKKTYANYTVAGALAAGNCAVVKVGYDAPEIHIF